MSPSKEDQIFKVERILHHRFTGGKKFYQVKWEGFGMKENTWEPEESFFDRKPVQIYENRVKLMQRRRRKELGGKFSEKKGFTTTKLPADQPSQPSTSKANEESKENIEKIEEKKGKSAKIVVNASKIVKKGGKKSNRGRKKGVPQGKRTKSNQNEAQKNEEKVVPVQVKEEVISPVQKKGSSKKKAKRGRGRPRSRNTEVEEEVELKKEVVEKSSGRLKRPTQKLKDQVSASSSSVSTTTGEPLTSNSTSTSELDPNNLNLEDSVNSEDMAKKRNTPTIQRTYSTRSKKREEERPKKEAERKRLIENFADKVIKIDSTQFSTVLRPCYKGINASEEEVSKMSTYDRVIHQEVVSMQKKRAERKEKLRLQREEDWKLAEKRIKMAEELVKFGVENMTVTDKIVD